MGNFFKSLFSGNKENKETEQEKQLTKNFEILKYDGLRAQRIGQTDYARKCFQEALNLKRDFETMNYLSNLYIQLNQLEEAQELLNEMTVMEPEYPDAFLMLANVYYLRENYPDMEQAAQKAATLDPKSAVARFLQAKAAHKMQNGLMTIAYLTQALVLKDDFLEAYLMRAEVLLGMNQLEEAEKDIQAALKLEEDNESGLLLQARWLAAQGKMAEAEERFRQIIEVNPFNEQAYLDLGNLLRGEKKPAEAIALFDEGLEMNPELSSLYLERGRAKMDNGDKDGATEDIKKAMELDPKKEEALNGHFNNLEPQTGGIPGIF